MKRFLPLLFVFLIFLQPVSAFNALEKLNQNQTYLCVCIRGEAIARNGTPPMNPFNDVSIYKAYIILPYNETHVWTIYYSSNGRKTEGPDKYYPQTPRVPFKLSEWNLSKILEEYQWGVENYLPNVSGGHWYKGYWNSTITRWYAEINATTFKVILHGAYCGECEQYITFECWRDGTNVTCQWGKPVLKVITPPWAPKDTTTSTSTKAKTTSTTSRTTSAPSSTQSTTSTKERKLCGPALIVGLALIPVLVKRR
ncbi:CGP-CTERM sorting domain-containing protein [Thermococcus sp.]|uniref:CGP-CTERM sorting domain-containing protein n=1 Tax=Thermococcus sp. TaxID=35749 RepID=UPI002638DA18|nr:CGP-CTERM sorting domain-containing protein [Thermococcus sp.]